MKFYKNFRNKIDFFLRKNLKFSREYKGIQENKANIFSNLAPVKREKAVGHEKLFFEKYKLKNLKDNSSRRIYLENLAIIELLENSLWLPESDFLKVLDIGSKNWFYVHGLYNFLKYNRGNRDVFLDGIELDAYRMYSNFYTRRDYACYYSKNLKGAKYIAGDFLQHREKYDYITWFFPFVTEFPLLQWGLPLSAFKPLDMLKHAVECLNPNGKILIVNQDEKEYKIQGNLLKELNLSYEQKGKFENSFLEYEHDRYITIVKT